MPSTGARTRDFEDLHMILRVGIHNGAALTTPDPDLSSGNRDGGRGRNSRDTGFSGSRRQHTNDR